MKKSKNTLLNVNLTKKSLKISLLSASCLALFIPVAGFAQCTTSGNSVTCSGSVGDTTTNQPNYTAQIGTGQNSSVNSVTINPNATVSYQRTVISLGSGSSTSRNSIAINGSVVSGGLGSGPNNTGANAVEFGSNTDVTVAKSGLIQVTSTGSGNAEAINPTGSGNVITNYGTIKTDSNASALWMQGTDTSVQTNGINAIDNYGVIQAGASGTGTIIGNSNSGIVHFTNRNGATVNGNISLGSSGRLANVVTFENGSNVNGTVAGGGSAATLNLTGNSGSSTLKKSVSGFGTLNKNGNGTWTVGAANAPLSNLSDSLHINVGKDQNGNITDGGTLILAGNISSKNAVIGIDKGTLQLGTGGTSGWVDGITHNNGTLVFNRSDTNTLSRNVDGVGQVQQLGSGKTILTGTNTYTGATTITNGTLQLGDGTNSGSIANSSAIIDNSNLTINNPTNTTISQVVSGSGSLTQQGNGAAILTNANTYSGTTTINNSSLQLGDGTNSGSIANSSAIIDNSNLTINNPTDTAISQVISGQGSLTQIGNSTTTLTGANTYTGATNISNGTLAVGSNGDISSSAGVHANSGNFDISGVAAKSTTIQSLDGGGSVNLGSKELVIANGNNTFGNVFSGKMSGSGGVQLLGGTETLSGNNDYTGQTTVAENATLNLPGAVAGDLVNAGTTNVNGGTVGGLTSNTGSLSAQNAHLQDINNQAGTATLNNTAVGAVTNAPNATFSAVGGTLTSADNSGTMTLGSGNTVVGDVTNNDGSLTLGKGNNVIGNVTNSKGSLTLDGNAIAGTLAANGGSFEVTSANSNLSSLAGSANGNLDGTLKIHDAKDTYSGSMTGQGGIEVLGGTETLAGANSYTGQTNVAQNATLNLPGAVAGDLVNAGTTNVNGGTVGGLTSNTGSLSAQNAHLQDINNQAGTTTLNNSTAGIVTNAPNATFSAVGGSLASATNSGTMTLGSGNNVAGDVTNNDGSLTLDGNAVAGTLAANGGSFEVTSAASDIASLAGSANGNLDGALNLHNAKDTYSGAMSGQGGLNILGGTETLTGANSYTGQTNVAQNAALNLPGAVAGDLVNAGTTNVNGGTVGGLTSNTGSLAAQNATLHDINNQAGTTTLNNSTAGIVTNAANATFSAVGGSLASATNSGTMTLGSGNNVAGDVTNNDGSLTLDGNAVAGTLAANGGSFEVTSAASDIASLAGSANGNLDGALNLHNAKDTYSGAMSGQGGLNILGGTETLAGANSYTGQTNVAQNAALNLPGAVAGDLVNAGTTNVNGGTVGGLTSNTGSLAAQNATLHDINNQAGTATLNNSTAGIVTNAANATFSAVGGSLASATNSGTMTLGSGNNVAGDVTNNDGSLTLDGNAVAGTLAANGGSFEVTSAASDIGSLAGSANGNLDGALNLHNAKDTYSGAMSGQGGLNILGGTETLAGANSYTGQTNVAQNAALNLPGAVAGGLVNAGTTNVNGGTVGGLTSNTGSLAAQNATLHDINNQAGTATLNNSTAGIVTNAANATFSAVGGSLASATNSGTMTLGSGNNVAGDVTNNDGSLTLDGNAVAGTLDANGGSFEVTSAASDIGSLAGSANGNLDGALNLHNAKDTYSGAMSGQGGLNILGGTETLTGANSYTGQTTIAENATLQLGNGKTSGTINNTQDIINHGTLSVNNSHAVTMPMLISSSGQFKQIGIGTTTLGDNNSYSGGTTITSGGLIGSAHSFGTGAINNYSALIIAQPSNATFDNSINGTGTLTKTGAGILTINSNNSLSGSTFINQGELAVNGSLASSSVTSQPGTILSGTGTVGGITAKAGSIIRPAGNIIGTLNVSGNYQQDAGATYAVQVLPGTNTSDVLSINGKASLSDGAILSVSKASPGNYTLDTKYRVLTAKGGVSGNYTLTGDTALSAFYGLGTTYDANNVYLEVKQDHLFVEEGKTSNQIAVAGGLDSLASNSVIKNVVGSLVTGDQARQAFNTLSGEIHASARTSLFQDSFYIRDITVERLRAADCGIGTDADTKKTCDIKKKRETEGACEGAAPALWMQSYGSWGRNSGNDNVATMNHSTGGFVLGADTPIGRSKWHIGGLFGYGYSSFNIPNRSSTGHSNNLTAGAYGGTSWGQLGFRMGASYTWNILSTNRTTTIGQFSNQLNGHYNGGTAQVFGDLGYRFDVGNTSLEPFANVAYVNLHTNSYHEHGGEAALHGKAIDTGLTYTTFGLRAAATLQKGDTAWIPNITVAYRHAFGDVDPTVTQRFMTGGNDFSAAGVPLSENSALVNAGFKVKAGKRITGGISYIGQYGDHYLSNGLRGTFSWIF